MYMYFCIYSTACNLGVCSKPAVVRRCFFGGFFLIQGGSFEKVLSLGNILKNLSHVNLGLIRTPKKSSNKIKVIKEMEATIWNYLFLSMVLIILQYTSKPKYSFSPVFNFVLNFQDS